MSYNKKTSLVQYGDWDEKSDSHPAMKWMHMYTNKIDEVSKNPLSPFPVHGESHSAP